MQIDVDENGYIRLAEIYNPVVLVASNETLTVCERDGIFETGSHLTPAALTEKARTPLRGDLVVVSEWSDFDWPRYAVKLGVLREKKDRHYYIDGSNRGYKYCRFVHRQDEGM